MNWYNQVLEADTIALLLSWYQNVVLRAPASRDEEGL